jgi:hypothetical protein
MRAANDPADSTASFSPGHWQKVRGIGLTPEVFAPSLSEY